MKAAKQKAERKASANLSTLRESHRLREWATLIRESDSLLEALGRKLARASSRKSKLAINNELAEALNLLGEAHRAEESLDVACACFEAAVEHDPESPRGYCNWAELTNRLGERKRARHIVQAGLARASETVELRSLQHEVIERPTVSICMIVKNEEEFLPNCLESVRDIADEIILVDTGSDDRTIQIAESFGCKVFHQKWEGDFSKHRNYSLKQATSDWIFVIDADEELVGEDIPLLRRCLNQDAQALLSVTVYNTAERSGKGVTFLPSVRLFRRELGLSYEGIVHNRLNYDSEEEQLRCPVRLIHHGYDLTPEKMKRKHERSKKLLEKQIAEHPNHVFAHFNLAQLIRAESGLGTVKAAEETLLHARLVIQLADPDSLRERPLYLMAHHQAATAMYAMKKYEEAERYCQAVLTMKPDYFDAVISLGYIYLQEERFDEAEKRFQEYLDLQEKFDEHNVSDGIIVAHFQSRHNAYYNLGLISESRQNWSQARDRYQSVLNECDIYLDTLARLGWLMYRLGDNEAALELFKKQMQIDPALDAPYAGMATILYERDSLSEAQDVLHQGIGQVNDAQLLYRQLARTHMDVGQTTEALRVLAEGINKYPDFAALYSLRGETYCAMREIDNALDSYQQAERLQPGEPEISLGIANTSLMKNDNLAAVRWYRVTLERDPNSAQATRNLAIALARMEIYGEADDLLRSYIELAPDDREARSIRGALLLKRGSGGEAVEIYEALFRDNPSDQTALLELSDCYLTLGSAESASLGYRRLLEINPHHEIAQNRLESMSAPVNG